MLGAKINLAKILLDAQKITPEELEGISALQKKTGKHLGDLLIEEKLFSEDELLAAVSYNLSIPFLDLTKFKIDPGIIKFIPEDLARKYRLFPLCKLSNVFLIAVVEPLDLITLDNLRIFLNYEIKQVLSREKTIFDCINAHYSGTQTLTEILDYDKTLEIIKLEHTEDIDPIDLIKESQKQPIVKAVDLVINEAIVKLASDIHLEPAEEALLVRYRIDGMLNQAYALPKKSQRGIAARIKILSGLDITKFYIPQDGRFHINSQGKDIDFRVSSLPTIFGEKFVLRLLDKSAIMVKLEELGFSAQPLSLLIEAIAKDHGMILMTGPTGSGKSTTLYAVLAKLNTIHRHIVTVDDPIEYQIDGITQVQVKPEINLTFAAALRGLLRQSPDTILLGEIRDMETADIAVKASLIGQLILSTLHTNNAMGAFARLLDMGIERYLVASSLILICAQRLCRKICADCKEPVKSLPKEITRALNLKPDENFQFYRGRGCSSCNSTGYRGRVALLEALKVDDDIKSMVIKEMPFDEIEKWAIKENRLITLRTDGLNKAFSGLTSVEEIFRVTARD